eukprot:4980177-Amphidinium_carterae.1
MRSDLQQLGNAIVLVATIARGRIQDWVAPKVQERHCPRWRAIEDWPDVVVLRRIVLGALLEVP